MGHRRHYIIAASGGVEQAKAIHSSEPARICVVAIMMLGLSEKATDPSTLMNDATYWKSTARHRACRSKKEAGSTDRAQQRWPEHETACADRDGKPLRFFLTAGQGNDYPVVAALLVSVPKAKHLLGDRGYDAD